jgi:hypothetical protein
VPVWRWRRRKRKKQKKRLDKSRMSGYDAKQSLLTLQMMSYLEFTLFPMSRIYVQILMATISMCKGEKAEFLIALIANDCQRLPMIVNDCL